MDSVHKNSGLSIKRAIFMDKPFNVMSLSMKRGIFMDTEGKFLLLSIKLGIFMDRTQFIARYCRRCG